MKKIIITALLIIGTSSFAQETKKEQNEQSLDTKPIKYSDLSTASRSSGYTSYLSKDGYTYKIGEKLKIGFPSRDVFAFITEGDGILLPITPLKAASSGSQTEIKKIFVTGSKNSGYSVAFRTKGYANMPGANYSIDVENAIAAGELVSFGLTSDQALIELKKAKDKFDLELITKSEYEAIKSDLSKYIK